MKKRLGKIQKVRFGISSYQDGMIGLFLTLGDGSWGVTWSICAWDPCLVKHSHHCKWTEEGRDKELAKIMREVSLYLSQAKVDNVNSLENIPVECTFDGTVLKEWRILTEVL
jgi:hypothetical protein